MPFRFARCSVSCLGLACLVISACQLPRIPGAVSPGKRQCTAEVCVTALDNTDSAPATFTIAVEAPDGTRLKNAMLRSAELALPPCQAGVPVASVSIDGARIVEGPTAIGGSHQIRLRFPQNPVAGRYPMPALLLQLDLEVRGMPVCLNAELTPAWGTP